MKIDFVLWLNGILAKNNVFVEHFSRRIKSERVSLASVYFKVSNYCITTLTRKNSVSYKCF